MSRLFPLFLAAPLSATGLILAAGTGAPTLTQAISAQATDVQSTGPPADKATGASASAAAAPTVEANVSVRPTSSSSLAASSDSEVSSSAKTLSASTMLFDFEGGGKARWRVETDRVMGGRSTGSAEVTGGTLVFAGTLVTEGGGFSSARARG